MNKVFFISGLIICHLASFAQATKTFTDERDGQTYNIVAIGTQIWMSENLNYATPDSWCYADSAINCEKYGRLYTWEAAKNACPGNWHLPTEEEWRILEQHSGMTLEETEIFLMRGEGSGTKLKSENEWEVKTGKKEEYDIFGFNALPGGFRIFYNGSFVEIGKRGSWWTGTPFDQYAIRRSLFYDKSGIDRDPATRTNAFSVRCVKD